MHSTQLQSALFAVNCGINSLATIKSKHISVLIDISTLSLCVRVCLCVCARDKCKINCFVDVAFVCSFHHSRGVFLM